MQDRPIVTGSAANDGLYEYSGVIAEVNANVRDKDAFAKGAILRAIGEIFDIHHVDVNEEIGIFTVRIKDKSHMHWRWTEKNGVELACKNKQ